jgi:hypothetical protein
MRLGGIQALEFYQDVEKSNFHFAYVNSARNYIINKVENLFNATQRAVMFANKETFIIHRADQDCSQSSGSNDETTDHTLVSDFVQSTYPKQKYLKIVATILEKHDLINEDLFFIQFDNIHLADFLSFINNRFDKKKNTNLIKLCKVLQTENVKFPNVCIKNPVAKKYLC